MCGITGAIWSDPARAISSEVLSRMTDALVHRGPDDSGTYSSDFTLRPPYESVPGVALGHRRLAIIDPAGGHQPMSNDDGTIWITFNGEIYNFAELRQRLEGTGHTFRTRSDTEALLRLYESEGVDFLGHVVGMFAVAIWDGPRRRLLLARDRLGQKPLVYRHERDRLLFASELKSLLTVPGVPREVDPLGHRRISDLSIRTAPELDSKRISQIAAGSLRGLVRWRAFGRALLVAGVRLRSSSDARRLPRPTPRGAPPFNRTTPDQRRTARRVSLGRNRFRQSSPRCCNKWPANQ